MKITRTFSMDMDIYEKLKQWSHETNSPMSAILCMILAEYFYKHEEIQERVENILKRKKK